MCWWEAETGMLKTSFLYNPFVNEDGQALGLNMFHSVRNRLTHSEL